MKTKLYFTAGFNQRKLMIKLTEEKLIDGCIVSPLNMKQGYIKSFENNESAFYAHPLFFTSAISYDLIRRDEYKYQQFKDRSLDDVVPACNQYSLSKGSKEEISELINEYVKKIQAALLLQDNFIEKTIGTPILIGDASEGMISAWLKAIEILDINLDDYNLSTAMSSAAVRSSAPEVVKNIEFLRSLTNKKILLTIWKTGGTTLSDEMFMEGWKNINDILDESYIIHHFDTEGLFWKNNANLSIGHFNQCKTLSQDLSWLNEGFGSFAESIISTQYFGYWKINNIKGKITDGISELAPIITDNIIGANRNDLFVENIRRVLKFYYMKTEDKIDAVNRTLDLYGDYRSVIKLENSNKLDKSFLKNITANKNILF